MLLNGRILLVVNSVDGDRDRWLQSEKDESCFSIKLLMSKIREQTVGDMFNGKIGCSSSFDGQS